MTPYITAELIYDTIYSAVKPKNLTLDEEILYAAKVKELTHTGIDFMLKICTGNNVDFLLDCKLEANKL